VPHTGDDNYVRGMATTLRDALRPDLDVYLEYSNEVWGTLFPAGVDAMFKGVKAEMWKLSGDRTIAASLEGDSDESRFCYLAWRSRAIYEIFADVFGAARRRVKLIVASQSVNADVSRRILGCNNSYVVAVASALSIAPYFNSFDESTNTQGWTPEFALNESLKRNFAEINATTREHAALARRMGLRLTTYEAGQSFLGELALVKAVNSHPLMRSAYKSYLELLAAANVSLINLFSSMGLDSQYGAWGLVNAMDYDPAASFKLQGVNDFASKSLQCSPFREPSACPLEVDPTSGALAPCGGPQRGLCVDTPGPSASSIGAACACRVGFNGPSCADHALVDVSTCSYKCNFHGQCVTSPNLLFGYIRQSRCECDSNYGGLGCSYFTCPKSCSFNGVCTGPNVCACFDGFGGDDCSIDCGAGTHGVCAWQPASGVATSGGPAAVCDAGYAFKAAVPAATLVGPGGAAYVRGTCAPVCDASCAAGCLQPGVCACAAPCAFGDCVSGKCMCWAGYGGPTCARRMSAAEAARANALSASYSPVGINLAGIAYWSTETPFCNLAVASSEWQSQYKAGLEPATGGAWNRADVLPNVSATGYPRSLAPDQALALLIARDVNLALPNGRYVVTWQGSARLSFGFDATLVRMRRGYAEIDVRFSTVRDNGILVRVEDMDEADPLRALSVVMPTGDCPARAASGFPFHADYIAFLRSLGVGALRFMDEMSTNNFAADAPPLDWAARPTLAALSYGGGVGVPVEHMVHLANVLGADPWFNMPHVATPSYHRGFAALVKATLRPDLTVFLERSNECWNPLFGCGKAAYAEAARLSTATAPVYGAHVHARRSAAMAADWRSVWSAAPPAPQRLSHVLSTQTVNSWITEQLLRNVSLLAGVDAIGVTAYIDCGGMGSDSSAPRTAQQSLDWVFAQCRAALPTINASWAGQSAAIAAALAAARAAGLAEPRRDIPLAVYEGGPGLVEQSVIERGGPGTPGLQALFTAAARDARMERLYRDYLDSFRALGLASGRGSRPPFMHFSSGGAISKYGSWGLIEYTGAPMSSSPKARALAGFARDIVAALTPTGCMSPGALNFDPAAVFSSDNCSFAPVLVSSAGAVIAPPGVNVSLTVPAGALGGSVALSVAQVPLLLGAGAANGTGVAGVAPLDGAGLREIATAVFRFGPAGTQFAAPVRVCLAVDDASAAYAASGNASLSLYSSGDGGASWELADASALEGGRLCGGLSHFTIAAGLRVAAATLSADVATAAAARPQPAASAAPAPLSAGAAGGIAAAAVILTAAAALLSWRWRDRLLRGGGATSKVAPAPAPPAEAASASAPAPPASASAAAAAP